MSDSELQLYDVLIIGAGPAGLSAAYSLKSAGRSYLILEARDRVGGRVHTATIPNANNGQIPMQASAAEAVKVDAGASWIHHSGPSNPVTQLAWSKGSIIGVPKGGHDMFLNSDGREPITRDDFVAGCVAYEEMQAEREALAEAHAEKYHGQSPFSNFTYAEYMEHSQKYYEQKLSANLVGKYSTTHSSGSEGIPPPPTQFIDPASTLSTHRTCHDSDCTFEDYLSKSSPFAAKASAMEAKLTPAAFGVYDSLLRDVECYEGSDLRKLSSMHAGDELDAIPDCNMQFVSGYGTLMTQVAEEEKLNVLLNHAVQAIKYDMDMVTVQATVLDDTTRPRSQHSSHASPNPSPKIQVEFSTAASPAAGSVADHTRTFKARYCIVTVPLGILQRRLIDFSPALPSWKTFAIDALGFGLLNKVFLQFPYRFWGEKDAKMNVLTVLQKEHPLWIVNFSPALHAYKRLSQARAADHDASSTSSSHYNKHDRHWKEYMQNAAPLAPPFLEDECVCGEETGTVVSASTSSASADADSQADGPHVFVSFHHNFDSADSMTSSHEAQSDEEIVGKLMKQLRKAFQAGLEARIEDASQLPKEEQIFVGTARTSSSVTHTTPFNASGETVDLPHAYKYPTSTYECDSRSPVVVPDPIAYYITRWGLEPFALGAYSHYRRGTGPHTCAVVGRPVAVQRTADGNVEAVDETMKRVDATVPASASSSSSPLNDDHRSVTRLLFAGEATFGVHIGCADSAWITGTREAKRIEELWLLQEKAQQ